LNIEEAIDEVVELSSSSLNVYEAVRFKTPWKALGLLPYNSRIAISKLVEVSDETESCISS
jgi:hypothetical protein